MDMFLAARFLSSLGSFVPGCNLEERVGREP